jgi:hypothetical protein
VAERTEETEQVAPLEAMLKITEKGYYLLGKVMELLEQTEDELDEIRTLLKSRIISYYDKKDRYKKYIL